MNILSSYHNLFTNIIISTNKFQFLYSIKYMKYVQQIRENLKKKKKKVYAKKDFS